METIKPYLVKSKKENLMPCLWSKEENMMPAKAPMGVRKAPMLLPMMLA